MIYLNKWFKIPGPKDLGMSESNHAMAMDMMRNYPGEPTWENYYERVKKEYPVKYFFASTLPSFFSDCWRSITRRPKDIYYWIVSHTIRRYHLVDIRQPNKGLANIDGYRYGWIDTDWRMVYALMNLLVEFVEKEMTHSRFIPSEEDAAKDEGMKMQLNRHKEYMAIYEYWTKERYFEEDKHQDLLHKWSESRSLSDDYDDPETLKLWVELQEFTELKDKKLEEMLHRLIDVRHCMWT